MRVEVDGREFHVGVRHGTTMVKGNDLNGGEDHERRCTDAWFRSEDGAVDLQAQAVCSPADNFKRHTGRKIAGVRLLEQMRTAGFNKDALRTVGQIIWPRSGRRVRRTANSN